MTHPDIIEGRALAPMQPPGSRPLGIRVKPRIRLGMGHKDPARGFPVKDDHFTVRGDDQAVAKFHAVFGDKPRSIPVLLPSSLDQALTIQYRAFKSAGDDEGGVLTAVGETNFALRDYVGGPDVIRHFAQDGTVEDLETAGLDANTREPLDETAEKLGIELFTTFRAGMPDVLGFGSYFEITSKGRESTDSLWLKLRELYGLFGSRVSFAVKPNLILRPSTARPVVTKNGETKRIKTTIYVLDLVVPESIDEMIDRLASRSALMAHGAVDALYGPVPGELPPARQDPPPSPPAAAVSTAAAAPPDGAGPDATPQAPGPSAGGGGEAGQQAGGAAASPEGQVASSVPGGFHGAPPPARAAEQAAGVGRVLPDVKKPSLNAAAETRLPDDFPGYGGLTVKEIHKDRGDTEYLRWLVGEVWEYDPPESEALIRAAARVYCEKQLPALIEAKT